MKFIQAKTRSDFLAPPASEFTQRQWISEGGRWTVQLDLVLYGVRCNVCRADDPFGIFRGYCCGPGLLAQLLAPRLVMEALAGIGEEETSRAQALLPEQIRKPLHNDPECWASLCRAAGVAVIDLGAGGGTPMPVTLADLIFGAAK